MYVAVVTPPEQMAVSLEDARAHLRVEHSDDDAYIEFCIAAAHVHLDGPAGWLGRSLTSQTLEARFDAFDACDLRLMYGPVASVSFVKYDDSEGVERTMSASDSRLSGPDGHRLLTLTPGASWPAVYAAPDCVRVRYVAGYGDAPEAVPAAIRHAVLLMVGDLYRFRETAMPGSVSKVEISASVEALLRPFRIYF